MAGDRGQEGLGGGGAGLEGEGGRGDLGHEGLGGGDAGFEGEGG